MTTDTEALIAELRGFAEGSESARATLMRDAADALEREHKRAEEAEAECRTLRGERNTFENDLADVISERDRFKAAIEAAEDHITRHYLDMRVGKEMLDILSRALDAEDGEREEKD